MENGVGFLAELQALAPHLWGALFFGLLPLAVLFAARGQLARLALALLRRALAPLLPKTGARLVEATESPLRLLFITAGLYFFVDALPLSENMSAAAERILLSLVVFALFRFLHDIIDLLVMWSAGLLRGRIGAEVEQWLCRGLRIFVIFVGGATILETWGIAIAPILAGLGIGGVAVALGAQDLFKNLIGGAMILLERRFGIGDWIKAEGVVEGTVESIGYRSTSVRQFDMAPVHVPNYQLSDTALVNYSAMTYRRIYWMVSLSYGSSIAQLREVREKIAEHIATDEAFESGEKISTFVRVDGFSDSSIDLLIYCFTKTRNWGEWLGIKEALLYRIKEIVEEAGTSFAFPSRSLYVESLPHGTPAAFAHPPERQLAPPPSAETPTPTSAPSGVS